MSKLINVIKERGTFYVFATGKFYKNFVFDPVFNNGLITRLLEGAWAYAYDWTMFAKTKKIMIIKPAAKVIITKYISSSFVGTIMGLTAGATLYIITLYIIYFFPNGVFNLDGLNLLEHLELWKNKFLNFFFSNFGQ